MKKISKFLPLAVAISLICLIIYGVGQQILRQGTNDPQIQISEDIAHDLSKGGSVSTLSLPYNIDLSESISPFVIIFDAQGKVIRSNATLNGAMPAVPIGVLNTARVQQNRVTWQPQSGVREAVVVTYFKNNNQQGFVLAGRSLRESEARTDILLTNILIGWIVTIFVSFLFTIFFVRE